MLAYAIIAVELAILYTVFWYVFLREPKPYRIKGNPWGAYDGPEPAVKNFASNFGQVIGLFHSGKSGDSYEARRNNAIYEEWNASSSMPHLTAGELIRSQSRGVERVTKDLPVKDLSAAANHFTHEYQSISSVPAPYLPNNPVEQQRKSRTIPAFLAELGDVLNRINVKIP